MNYLNSYNKKTKGFSQHNFGSKIEIISGIPKIIISKVAYNKMWHYVDLANQEVSWLGTVVQQDNDYMIQDVFLLKQEVSGCQTVITENGLADFGEGILKLQNGVELYNNIRFWGHSHVHMGTGPSGQDDEQMVLFENSEHPFFIRGILNKCGRMEFTIYFYSSGIKISDAEWCIYDPVDSSIRETIEDEFNTKVSEQRSFVRNIYDNYLGAYNKEDIDYDRAYKNKKPRQKRFTKNGSYKTIRNFQTKKF